MNKELVISGFSDEISSNLDTQLEAVSKLGMNYISLRGIDGRNVGDFTVDEIKESVLPRLQKWEITVSSIGSPIGKVFIHDEDGFEKQKVMLDTLCQMSHVLDCKYIRLFSFYIPKDEEADRYKEEVVTKLKAFVEIAKKYHIILLHENEKDIYGDIASRCYEIIKAVDSPNFKAIFDFANFVQCGEDTQKCYDLLKAEVTYIHIKDAVTTDSQNVVCGTGEGRIPEILTQFIEDGYKGFLTLEPHLVLFDSLKDLELVDSSELIKGNKGLDGAAAYKLQYDSLLTIINNIKSEAKR